MSKKLIRKQPLLSKIKSYPFDLLLYLNELRLSIEWDTYATSIAIPLGIGLTFVSLLSVKLINYYYLVHSKSDNIVFQTSYYNYEKLKSKLIEKNYSNVNNFNYSFIRFINMINYLLIGISMLNCYLILNSFRDYNLLYCNEKPSSSSIKRLSLNKESLIENFVNFLKKISHKASPDDEGTFSNEINLIDKEIYQLSLWVPSKFSLYLFMVYNPLNLFVIKFYSINLPLFKSLLLIFFVSVNFFVLIIRFLNLVNDKQILYQEMFNEFNNKFVKPKTSTLKKDVLIDSTKGPLHSSILTDIKPYLFNKSKVFITHDIHGNAINSYESDESSSNSTTTNTVRNIFPRNETYKQFQFYNNPNNNDLFRIKFENDELKKRNNQLTRQIEFFKNIKANDVDDDDELEKWYSSSTPFKSSRSNFSPINKENNRSDFYTSVNKLNKPPQPMNPYRSPSLKSPDLNKRSPQRSPSLRSLNTRTPELNRSPNLRSINGRSPNRSPSPSKPRWH